MDYGSAGSGDDFFCDGVGFDFVGIAGLAEAKFGLNRSRFQKLQHRLIAQSLL